MTSSLADKKVVVVAGTRGIGKAIVDELNNEKASVIATSSHDLDTSNIKQVKE